MNERPTLIMPSDAIGKQIIELLQGALGVPAGARWFEVRFEIGQPITFNGEFYAQAPAADVEEPTDDDPPPRIGASLDDRG